MKPSRPTNPSLLEMMSWTVGRDEPVRERDAQPQPKQSFVGDPDTAVLALLTNHCPNLSIECGAWLAIGRCPNEASIFKDDRSIFAQDLNEREVRPFVEAIHDAVDVTWRHERAEEVEDVVAFVLHRSLDAAGNTIAVIIERYHPVAGADLFNRLFDPSHIEICVPARKQSGFFFSTVSSRIVLRNASSGVASPFANF